MEIIFMSVSSLSYIPYLATFDRIFQIVSVLFDQCPDYPLVLNYDSYVLLLSSNAMQ